MKLLPGFRRPQTAGLHDPESVAAIHPLRRALRSGPLGLGGAEALSLLLAILFTTAVGILYWKEVRPLGGQQESLRRREAELKSRLEKRSADERKLEEQTTNSDRILQSLQQFEDLLKSENQGIALIISEMDAAGKSTRVIVGDASYRVSSASPIVDSSGKLLADQASGDKTGVIYPGMAVDTTVIGDYPNLRRFISSLERSRQFLVINSLAFQGEADKVRREASRVGSGSPIELASPDSVPVSLKIELDAYFQRPPGSP